MDRLHPPIFISINGYFCVAVSRQQYDSTLILGSSGEVNGVTIVVVVVYFEKVLRLGSVGSCGISYTHLSWHLSLLSSTPQ